MVSGLKLKIFKALPFLILLIAVLFLASYKPLKVLDYSATLYSQDGELLSYQIAKDEQWRLELSKNAVPESLKTALITLEDKRFYNHIGVDFIALFRALKQNLQKNRVVSGASTLTMQLARLNLGLRKRSFKNKLIETLYAYSFYYLFAYHLMQYLKLLWTAMFQTTQPMHW